MKAQTYKATNHWPIEKFEHNTQGEDGKECPCDPILEFEEGGVVIIHKRMDRANEDVRWKYEVGV